MCVSYYLHNLIALTLGGVPVHLGVHCSAWHIVGPLFGRAALVLELALGVVSRALFSLAPTAHITPGEGWRTLRSVFTRKF